ncbi:MAG: SDR family oxidoreductase [Actinobacteria bacterium]|nr:SDR family oxidoreductase [Actinomycetota bacterium]
MEGSSVKKMFDLNGKVALVTGSRNLGFDAAETLCELGATVIITSRNISSAQEAAKKLGLINNSKSKGMQLEVTDETNWNAVVKDITDEFGTIDILVNNAGGRDPSFKDKSNKQDLSIDFLENRPLAEWQKVINVNLTGVFLGCKTVAPVMKEKRKGKIINISSLDGIVGRDLKIYKGTGLTPTVPDYLASKAGVIQLTRAVGVVLAPFGINVNCISYGGFLRKGQPEKFVKNYTKLTPLGRMAKAGFDSKGAVAYLASSASDYVVGHNLVVDGGWTAW